jgi:UDP-glucose 4-epimerase
VLDNVRSRPGVGFTYLSSGGAVYGELDGRRADEASPCRPLSAYGISKLAAENYVAMYAHRYDMPARIVRVANAYGPGQRVGRGQGLIATLVDAAATGRPAQVYGDGTHVRDYVHVDDVADAVVALTRTDLGPLVVNVGTGVGHSIRDVVRVVEQTSGRAIPLRYLPGRGFDVSHNVLDVSTLRNLIDWTPTPLPAGIGATYAAHARLSSSAARVRSA